MLSGNGRHRRPRQAPAIVVAAGVTGSAIAIPLLGAGSASAADAATWDRVAECESGGNWSIDTGNGFYGGLQLSQEAWESFGGTAYAPTADLASRSQQITVAERVLDARGAGTWQACSVVAGLTDDGPDSALDPGLEPEAAVPAAEAPGTGSPKSGPVAEGPGPMPGERAAEQAAASPSPSPSVTSDGAAAPSAAPVEPSSEPSAEPSAPAEPAAGAPGAEGSAEGHEGAVGSAGRGKHRGAPAEEAGQARPDEAREGDGHPSRGDGSVREGAAGAAPEGSYTVQEGDSLWGIAEQGEVPGGWSALYEANEAVVGEDPDLILPGQTLELGAEPAESPAP
ncbi:resuscitation-promoting factor protein RpfC [Streptomyces sanyensis]|uniref:Resuscitation-promoting factor protein RpfC n=1 Tax=Streptomyces sanyensis TaxID=568869 RepID=A0ABP9B0E9_9ACTN